MKNKRGKTTFTLPGNTVDDFVTVASRLGIRRDAYINEILHAELDVVEKKLEQQDKKNPAGCRTAIQISNGIYQNTAKISISLDQGLIERLNSLCKARRIPRNVLMLYLLRAQTFRLWEAEHLLYAPSDEIQVIQDMMGDWYHELVIPDAQIWKELAETAIMEDH